MHHSVLSLFFLESSNFLRFGNFLFLYFNWFCERSCSCSYSCSCSLQSGGDLLTFNANFDTVGGLLGHLSNMA
ncbi:hypothetical protein K2173_022957 [Erythroxylum novogranatense]|uniref:Secreted protein n=1 Tax=Erythroxylum novogranatense TaxID=1862640 RepID=A0AAV8T9C2_9ROSI|nr:hypothetical protein K2173_022957 [Erythroxylum novogranatense]